MITANQKKFVKSLAQKKFRTEYNCFVVEGEKLVHELIDSDFEIEVMYALKDWIEENQHDKAEEVSAKELASISLLKTPNQVLAVVKQKKEPLPNTINSFSIVLDKIQDPGNLGTIIRTADWFGIKTIICSDDSVDVYNPKVIQATMGSIFRVNVYYTCLKEYLSNISLKVYGATLNGKNLCEQKLDKDNSVLLMGNESKGISEDIMPLVTNQVLIPKKGKAESLNVAVATSILCYEFAKE